MRAPARTATILTATAATAALALTAVPASAETAPTWKKPVAVTKNGNFSDVASSGWGNIWATGNVLGSTRPLAAHWNGSAWSKVALPSGTKGVDDVTSSTTNNTWLLDTEGATHLRKWANGKWSAPGHGKGVTAIAATGSNVLWAGGEGFIRHYDGNSWKQRALAKNVTIDRIAAHGSSDVWAVGHRELKPNDKFDVRQRPFAMHWNGTKWTTTKVPGYPADGGDGDLEQLDDVAFVGTNDIYATGSAQNTDEEIQPILVHWNGKTWSKVSTKSVDGGLIRVAPADAGGLSAVSRDAFGTPETRYRSTSGTWSTPNLPGTDAHPGAVLRIPGTTKTIAVGTANKSGSIWLDS